jgi:holliday junction DNA helicase RuvA
MIARLSGRIDNIADGQVVVDVGGVGYLVTCSTRTLGRLHQGQACVLLIEAQWREDGPHLFGFLEEAERRWFRLLVTIPGVGPKVAIAILGAVAPDELAVAVAVGDRAVLTRAAGVGAKLAMRIATELKDKAGTLPVGSGGAALAGGAAAAGTGGAVADAVSALINLGFRPMEAQAAVTAAAGGLDGEPSVETLIRGGLAQLTQKELRP